MPPACCCHKDAHSPNISQITPPPVRLHSFICKTLHPQQRWAPTSPAAPAPADTPDTRPLVPAPTAEASWARPAARGTAWAAAAGRAGRPSTSTKASRTTTAGGAGAIAVAAAAVAGAERRRDRRAGIGMLRDAVVVALGRREVAGSGRASSRRRGCRTGPTRAPAARLAGRPSRAVCLAPGRRSLGPGSGRAAYLTEHLRPRVVCRSFPLALGASGQALALLEVAADQGESCRKAPAHSGADIARTILQERESNTFDHWERCSQGNYWDLRDRKGERSCMAVEAHHTWLEAEAVTLKLPRESRSPGEP